MRHFCWFFKTVLSHWLFTSHIKNLQNNLKFLTNFLNFRTSMEESSHSTPSPMSSAASSQDSLHRNAATLHYHQMHHQNPYGNLMTNTLPANSHLGLGEFSRKKQKIEIVRLYNFRVKNSYRILKNQIDEKLGFFPWKYLRKKTEKINFIQKIK